ncbi:cell cycle histidine kinase CckA [Flexibacterium corallicola]|uniref:cell cycle histidine kinase CckA n=1 Tax=Flexibacterium corallicola TaxID=3037259 RepID=UPI00286FA141|nr:response regulator [Pseudovibrio sp. M1P-2-3]
MTRVDLHALQQRVQPLAKPGSTTALVFLGGLLLSAVLAIAFAGEGLVQGYILGLLAVLSCLGLLALFAYALGYLRLSLPAQEMPFAQAYWNSIDEGAVITDPQGHVHFANTTYLQLTGAEQMSKARSVERAFANEPEANQAIYQLCRDISEGRKSQAEIRLKHPLNQPEGKSCWYRIKVQPIHNEAGVESKSGLVIWHVSDISKDRLDQETSFRELQRAINFLDHAPSGFMSCDPLGKLVYLNATLAEWLGHDLTAFEAGKLKLSDIVRGDGASLILSMAGGEGEVKTGSFDVDLVTRKGIVLPVRLLHRVTFGSKGQPGESRTLVLNRSKGEESAEALRAAEVRFSRFFNSAPMAIASVDSKGRIERTNAPFAKLFGTSDSAVNRSQLADLVQEGGRKDLLAALESAGKGHSNIQPLDLTLGIGGEERSGTFYVSGVLDTEADEGTSMVYVLETTQQKTLEVQFAQSQKMQAVGQLAGGVAHDFNNVLTAIIGFSDLLLASHRPTDPAFQDIMNIKQNANRAAGLVRQLLAFSRRQTLRPKELELSHVLQELTILLDRLLGEKVELKVVHGRDLWPVMADVNQLEQVIVNLAVNARDAMPDGGTLSIRTRNVERKDCESFENTRGMPASEYVLIEVKDCGQGMPASVISKIFDPFFSTKDVGKGTGLGLSTVYGIIKQTGGFIFCQSEVGKGATFNIFLPRHLSEEKSEEPENKVKSPPLTDLTGSASILLVEDEEAVRAFAARALSSRGYKVYEAGSGTEALELLEDTDISVDLVVSDVVMPEMDGPSLLIELRKTCPSLKIIFVSGYAQEAFEKNLPEGEQFTFLPKPFSLKQLAVTVKEVLDQGQLEKADR